MENEKPKFTLLTTAFNTGIYLEDWCKSILKQNYRPLEVVFVDDVSTDSTVDIAREKLHKLNAAGIETTLVLSEQKLYYADALCAAWQNATGTFFGVLDSDDMLNEGAVEFIMSVYQKHPEIGFIYTQFSIYDNQFSKFKGKGFSYMPQKNESLLDAGRKRKHGYSHWRTFSTRVPKLHKIFKAGLKSAVDKYMGYRLEELAPGMFIDRACYLYRGWVPGSISLTEKSKERWAEIIVEARNRRKKYNTKPFKIVQYKG